MRFTIPTTLPIVPPSSFAWGFRKIIPGWSGDCCQIRRLSDGATTEIGFVGNAVDSAAIAAHCVGTTGYVNYFYEQNGTGMHLNGTATDAIIYDSGAILTDGNGNIASSLHKSKADMVVTLTATDYSPYSVAMWWDRHTGTSDGIIRAFRGQNIIHNSATYMLSDTANTVVEKHAGSSGSADYTGLNSPGANNPKAMFWEVESDGTSVHQIGSAGSLYSAAAPGGVSGGWGLKVFHVGTKSNYSGKYHHFTEAQIWDGDQSGVADEILEEMENHWV